ncbi:hypothetical protein VN97_g450 [Penicillium thymicola]|uniref:Uncharacterized protein n=1 Tax=Penicillium thymicola TaxID=293382 RepID=A0AAI9TSR3_PENTH|nr:hypothetical protein VN97_g450 [Penicillium thymicola]
MPDIMTALPSGVVTSIFSRLEYVQLEAEKILETLEKDEEENGNQFLVLFKLSPYISEQLFEDHGCLKGVNYRFEFEGKGSEGGIGLLRVIPGYRHEYTTMRLLRKVSLQLNSMGLNEQYCWGGATRYKSLLRDKEGDQVFSPSKCWPSSTSLQWPTVVVETGVSGACQDYVKMLDGGSEPLMEKAYIDRLRRDPSNVSALLQQPPLQQPSNMQQPYSCAEVDVTETTVDGAPMTIPYCALFDVPIRPPNMQDVVLDAQDFRFIIAVNFS